MHKFYTYFHTRNDTGVVFYVGKGNGNRANSFYRNKHWVNIAKKHGRSVHIAMYHEDEQSAFEHEKLLIACFRDMSIPLCNRTNGGDGPTGLVHTAATKEKMKLAHTGRKASEETKEKMRLSSSGVRHTPESLIKIGLASARRTHSYATRLKMSKSHTGKIVSSETCAKLSLAKMGKPVSNETREKQSLAKKGKPLTLAHCKKISAALIGNKRPVGFKHTDETKEKMRISRAAFLRRQISQFLAIESS